MDTATDGYLIGRARVLATEARALEEVTGPRPGWGAANALLGRAAGDLWDVDTLLANLTKDGILGAATQGRVGDFLGTRSGACFWPLSPRQEDVTAEDVGHSLFQKARWNGMASRFYPVGEHTLRAAWGGAALAKLEGFSEELQTLVIAHLHVHDGNEAYLPDIPTPVKPFIPGWLAIEDGVQAVVTEHFGLGTAPAEVMELVERCDRYMKVIEARELFSEAARSRWGTWKDEPVPLEFERAAWDMHPVRVALINVSYLTQLLRTLEADANVWRAQWVKAGPPAPPPADAPQSKLTSPARKVSAADFEAPEHLKKLLGD